MSAHCANVINVLLLCLMSLMSDMSLMSAMSVRISHCVSQRYQHIGGVALVQTFASQTLRTLQLHQTCRHFQAVHDS
jgi:hypothetical protein